MIKKSAYTYGSALLLWLLFLTSCTSINIEQEKERIQTLMDQVSAAHFEQDANKFYAPNADTWWDVRNGQVTKSNKELALIRIQSYLDNMEFLELSPSHDPIIEISTDGTLASYIGAVHVKGRYAGTPVFWVVSWQSVLRKQDGNWKIIQTANTEKTEPQMATIILEKSRERLRKDGKLDEFTDVFALADCKGPTGDFQTLLMSDMKNTRFEQKMEQRHMVLAVNEDKSWGINLLSNNVTEPLDSFFKHFVYGHELHWLSWRPESRYSNPVFKGFKEYAGRMGFDIEFKDLWNRPVHFYYDFEDYRPLGFSITNDNEGIEETIPTYFKNWEMVNDILTFRNAEFHQGDAVFEYTFKQIEWNQLKASDFEDRKGWIE